MISTKTKQSIDIPLRAIFTDDGIQFFQRCGKKIAKFRNSGGQEEFGIYLVQYRPETVQRMMLKGYITKLEFDLVDIVGRRRDVIDLCKLLSYGMLYRQFDTDVTEELLRSDLIRQWNRNNPKTPIDIKTRSDHPFIYKTLAGLQEQEKQVRIGIHKQVLVSIEENGMFSEQEKSILGLLGEKFLQNLSPLVMLMLSLYHETKACAELSERIQRILSAYIEKSVVGEYLSLMIIEILTFLQMNRYSSKMAGEGLFQVSFKSNRKRQIPDDHGKLQIVIRDGIFCFDDVKTRINERANITVKERSLKDFYTDSALGGSRTSLGLYYLSYLKDACKKMDIRFDSFVSCVRGKETFINLSLTF